MDTPTSPPSVATSAVFGPVIVIPISTPECSLAELRAAGYVPVLSDNPEAVRVLMPGSQVVCNDMLMAALDSVANCGYSAASDKFVTALWRRMKAREASGPNDQMQTTPESKPK